MNATESKFSKAVSLLESAMADANEDDLAEVRRVIAYHQHIADALREVEQHLEEMLGKDRQEGVSIPLKEEATRPYTNRAKSSNNAVPANSKDSKQTAEQVTTQKELDKRVRCLKALHAAPGGRLDVVNLSVASGVSRFGPGAISTVIDHLWFHKTPDEIVCLTDDGERACRRYCQEVAS